MRKLISYFSRFSLLRGAVRTLRLHKVGNAWLRMFPSIRVLRQSGVRYRAVRMESLPLAVEMFDKNSLYDAALLPDKVEFIADLGSNVGYFSCWMMHQQSGKKLRGLMIDANPEAVAEAVWHADANGMEELHALNGLVGEGAPGRKVEFFLCESSVCSTAHLPEEEISRMAGKWRKIEVPCLSVEEEWIKRFGNAACDLLKLDIEGSELSFLKNEPEFLKRCGAVLLEWHKWAVSLSEIEATLNQIGFSHIKTLEEGDNLGTAFFLRDKH